MIIDAHVKLGACFSGKDHTAEDYLREMDANGIDRAVVCPNKPLSYQVEEGNDYVESLLERFGDRFIGAVRVDPWKRERAIGELDRRFRDGRNKAIYLNPWEENFQCNHGVTLPIMGYARDHRLPVMIEAGYPWVSHISQIGDLARKYPGVKILATNAGQLDLSGLTLGNVRFVLNKYQNVYLGTASAVAAEWLAELIQKTARGRVLFETGSPLFEVYLEKYRIDHAYIEDPEKKDVFWENASGFLSL